MDGPAGSVNGAAPAQLRPWRGRNSIMASAQRRAHDGDVGAT